MLDTAEQLTVTLLSYGGLSQAAWQRRFARAEQALALRGPQRNTKLLLRLPTPNPTAFQSILSISEAAGRAVTNLEVQQVRSSAEPHEGVHTASLRALPAAFPNLRTLRIHRLCGCLPPPGLLPHLREVDATIRPQPAGACQPHQGRTANQLFESIAPYLPQLTTISISIKSEDYDWSQLFKSTSKTLHRFRTSELASPALLRCLRTHAPALEYFLASWGAEGAGDHSQGTWAVRELGVWFSGAVCAKHLAQLPHSPHGLMLQAVEGPTLSLSFDMCASVGLTESMQQRMASWTFMSPCKAYIVLPSEPDMSLADLRAGIEAALNQLKGLPAGSVVQLCDTADTWTEAYSEVVAAVAAAAAALPHMTIMPPAVSGRDDSLGLLLDSEHPVAHACVENLLLSGAHAKVPWPWQSLLVEDYAGVPQPLRLPDPTAGQYEIEIRYLYTNSDPVFPFTHDMLSELEQRLQHWTFVVRSESTILVDAPQTSTEGHPAAMHAALQPLHGLRWRRESDQAELSVRFEGWSLSPEITSELVTHLPLFDFPVFLVFSDCSWPFHGQYERLARDLPVCYRSVELLQPEPNTARDRFTVQNVKALCAGLALREQAAEQAHRDALRAAASGAHAVAAIVQPAEDVCIAYACKSPAKLLVWYDAPFTDEARSQAEACVDERALGRHVEIEWRSRG